MTNAPLPSLEGLVSEFYGWTRQGELRFQRCSVCLRWRHVPRPMCPDCQSTEWSWEPSSGSGQVYSFTVTHRALHPAFEQVPYAHGIVETEEGVRLIAALIDVEPDQIEIGLPVELTFRELTPDVVLPVYRPHGTARASTLP